MWLDLENEPTLRDVINWGRSNSGRADLPRAGHKHDTHETYYLHNITQDGWNWRVKSDCYYDTVISNGTESFNLTLGIETGENVKRLSMTGLVEMTLSSTRLVRPKQWTLVLLNITDPNNPDYSGLNTTVLDESVAFLGHLRLQHVEDLLDEDLQEIIGFRVNGTGHTIEEVEDDVPFEEMHRSYRVYVPIDDFW